MTKRELEELINECIEKRALLKENNIEDVDIDSVNEDTEIEMVNEGIVSGILSSIILALVAPYIAVLGILIFIAPIIIIANRAKNKKVEELIKNNPVVNKVITNFIDKTKGSIIKASGKNSKYLENFSNNYFDTKNFIFKNDKNFLIINLFSIDSEKVLEDLYGISTYEEYIEKFYPNHDDLDIYPPLRKEIKNLISEFNKVVKDINKSFKEVSKTSKISLNLEEYDDNYEEYHNFFTYLMSGDQNDAVRIFLTIEFSDYSNIEINDKYKALFNKTMEELKSKIKVK